MSVLFWLVALFILLYMAGLRVNWTAKTVRATSSIYIELANKAKEPVEYILNGQTGTGTAPITLGQLTPGSYSLTVRQADHQEWHRSFRLDPGQAVSFTDILLVPTLITPRTPTEAEAKLADSPLVIADEGLRVNRTELYLQEDDEEELLLRLSEQISQAVWLPDKAHIVLLAGQTAALVEVSGTNMTPLFTVPAEGVNRLFVSNDGAAVVLSSNGTLTAYDIAAPGGFFWTRRLFSGS